MKVMHVVEAFGGGIYSFLVELCNAIANDYEVVIVYSNREQTPKNFKKDFNNKIKFIYLDMCRGMNPSKNISSLFELKNIISNEDPDVVHLHSSKAGFIGRIACKQIGFDMNKVLYNPHGFSFLQQNESIFKRKMYFYLEKFAASLGGIVIGCSKGEEREAKKISKYVINIDNSINTNKIDELIKDFKINRDKNDNNIVIGTVGRICFQKNPKMFNGIAKKFPEFNFIWIGDGEIRNELEAKNIRITGWMSRKDVLKELMNIDIFILTSLWEGLPIALLEAMYLKKVVIVSNVIGNRDVVVDRENGYLCNNAEEFIENIGQTINDEYIRKEFSRLAYDHIKNNYILPKMVKKYKTLYDNSFNF